MIGKTILHYKIIEKLGEGGMGVVYLAEDSKLERKVAIKFLPSHIASHSDERERFKIEAKAAAALNHPNIATIYSIEEVDDDMFIVMEHIDGQELKKKISKDLLDLDKSIKMAIQVAEGLKAAHKKDIIHRDIKSANIMLTEDGQVKIMDFGLAKIREGVQLTKKHSTLGTAPYMSPEQTRGEDVDLRSDIWSFGVVLYELLTSQLPFKGEYEQAVIYSILNDEPIPITELQTTLPKDLEQIVNKALKKDLAERYENVEEILDDLTNINLGSGSRHVYSKSHPKKNKYKKINKLTISVAVAIILLIAAVFYFNFFKSSDRIISSDRKMMVVLPFTNIGNDPKQEFFADGMTEEMITILGNVNPEKLGVIARTTAMQFKKRDIPFKTIGMELGVGYILEGSIRRYKNQLRIAAKLIKVEDQTLLWSKSFDSTMDDIFALQSSVANQIAEALAIKLLQSPQLSNRFITQNPQAYDKYLTGRFFAHKGTEENWRNAIKYYEEAVLIDPEFVLCYAALAHAYSMWSTWNTVLPKTAYDKAKKAAITAFQLNPNLADTHSALAVVAMYFEWDWKKAEEEFKIAIKLNPNDGETYHNYGHYLSFMDRDVESVEAFKNALKYDPLSAYHRICIGSTYIKKKEIGLAESSIKKALELDPESPFIYYTQGFLRERQNRMKEAVNKWEKAVLYSNRLPQYLGTLGYGYGMSGQTEKALKILKELQLKSRSGYIAATDISKVYAGLRYTDKAFASLKKALSNREPWILGLKLDPGYDSIRNDPRFKTLLHRIGLK